MIARTRATDGDLGRPRWQGAPGRLEVWYATFSAADGIGYWIHHETVAPSTGAEDAYGHGWTAVFPTDGPPSVARFGPVAVTPHTDGTWFRASGVECAPGCMTGTAGSLSWDLTFTSAGSPLYTFPRSVWQRQLLPGAQIVPWPQAHIQGTYRVGGRAQSIDARGAVARIYGHGNAQRWCWLHADLGDGAVIELVSAVSRRGGLRRLPPLATIQLRQPGEPDWPTNPLLAAVRFRSRLGPNGFVVSGRVGMRRLRIEVELPAQHCVALEYVDPDGGKATCTNSERANAAIVLQKRRRQGWEEPRRWSISGTAHAEVGTRP